MTEPEPRDHGCMPCQQCGSLNVFVIDTRWAERYVAVKRRRRCGTCDHRFTTYESTAQPDPWSLARLRGQLQVALETLARIGNPSGNAGRRA